jgi:hypothetical protein
MKSTYIHRVIKRGRKPKMDKRDKPVSVYLNEDERKSLQALADAEGISLAAYLRRLLIAATKEAPKK